MIKNGFLFNAGVESAISNCFICFVKIAKMSNKKYFAFTLAETLIVMGIIGVVAALTLPNLNSSTGNKEILTKVKKITANFEDAMGRAQTAYGPFDEWTFMETNTSDDNQKRAASRVIEFLKITKDCGLERDQGCFSSTVTGLNGATNVFRNKPDNSTNQYKLILADGTSLGLYFNYSRALIYVLIDIDGPNKGPGVYGKDVFFLFYKTTTNLWEPTELKPQNAEGWGETGFLNDGVWAGHWIMRYDNLDYLKCPASLSDNVTTCPN